MNRAIFCHAFDSILAGSVVFYTTSTNRNPWLVFSRKKVESNIVERLIGVLTTDESKIMNGSMKQKMSSKAFAIRRVKKEDG